MRSWLFFTLAMYVCGCAVSIKNEDEDTAPADTQVPSDTDVPLDTSAPADTATLDTGCGCETCCDGACVDTASDIDHCGACDNACGKGACAQGACALRVFATSQTYVGGEIGGLSTADAECQRLANQAELTGSWQAWLSAQDGDPASRFATRFRGPYVLARSHVRIANSWEELTSGVLQNPINRDENDSAPPAENFCSIANAVWTGTAPNGQELFGLTCNNWGATTSGGTLGDFQVTGSTWTAAGSCASQGCENSAVIYCFEQ